MVWQQALRKNPGRPRGRQHRQFDVLLSLSTRLDWPTGKGFASMHDLCTDADVGERTARRALTWAQEHGWLEQTQRGHRLGDGTVTASRWELLLPSQPANSRAQPANSDSQPANWEPQPASRNGRLPESITPESTPPGRVASIVLSKTDATRAEAEAIAAAYEADPKVGSAFAVLRAKEPAALQAEVRKAREVTQPTPTPPTFCAPSVRGAEPTATFREAADLIRRRGKS